MEGRRISTCLRSHGVEQIDWQIVNEVLRYVQHVSVADNRQPVDIAISCFEDHKGNLQAVEAKMSAELTRLKHNRICMHRNQLEQVFFQLNNRRIFIDENVRYIVRNMLSSERRSAMKVDPNIEYKMLSDHQLSNVLAKVLKRLKSEDEDTGATEPSSTNDMGFSKENRQLLRDAEKIGHSDHAEALVIGVTRIEHDRNVKSIHQPTTVAKEFDTTASNSRSPENEPREHDIWRSDFKSHRYENAQVGQVLSTLRTYDIAIDQTIIQDARLMMREEIKLASRALSIGKLSPDQQVLKTAATIWENVTYPRTISGARANPTNSSTINATTPPSVASPNQRILPWIVPAAGPAPEQQHRKKSRKTRFDVSNDSSSRRSVPEAQRKERDAASYSPAYKNIHWIHISADHIESEVDDDYISEDCESPSPIGAKKSVPQLGEKMAAGCDSQGFPESYGEAARNLTAPVQHICPTHKSSKQEGTQCVIAGMQTKTGKDPTGRSEDLLFPVYGSAPPTFLTFISGFRYINSAKTWINRSDVASLWEELLMTEFLYSHIQARVKVEEQV